MLLMSEGVCKFPTGTGKCPTSAPLSVSHKYYQLGHFTIAGILSQIYISSEMITFEKHPFQEVVDEPLYGVSFY